MKIKFIFHLYLLQNRNQRHWRPLTSTRQPQLCEVGQVLHEPGVVLQGQAVAVDAVGAGEGDVEPLEPPGQHGPTVPLDHVREPGGAVPVEGGEAQLLLPVNAQPCQVWCRFQDVVGLQTSVYHTHFLYISH